MAHFGVSEDDIEAAILQYLKETGKVHAALTRADLDEINRRVFGSVLEQVEDQAAQIRRASIIAQNETPHE